MAKKFNFDFDSLNAVAGGKSAIDIPKLRIHTLDEATQFLNSYGYNFNNQKDIERLWYFHRRAYVLMIEKLKFLDAEIPEVIKERKQLQDIRNLLIYASKEGVGDKDVQRWACAFLRCMHVFVHSETDLFQSFSEEIQAQVISPIEKAIYHDGNQHRIYLKSEDEAVAMIPLLGFEVKPFKTSSSSVIKLLSKPDAIAMRIFDKLGFRFITNSIFDSFQVIRFLSDEHIISFPHIMPDQSSNNIYPVELFYNTCMEIAKEQSRFTDEEIEKKLIEKFNENKDQFQMLRKENQFSGADYRFIKFIARKKIHIQLEGGREFSFFYPFEVQIMDEASRKNILAGPSEHQSYKTRQIEAAKARLFQEK